jgi:hypothetical protein
MPNDHFAILKRGIDVWNHWREQNPGIPPDLHRADLQGCQLNGANLSGAYLAGAKMTGSFMFQTRLDGANLDGSRLVQADLCEACLSAKHGPPRLAKTSTLARGTFARQSVRPNPTTFAFFVALQHPSYAHPGENKCPEK